jgi:hypothetical protein
MADKKDGSTRAAKPLCLSNMASMILGILKDTEATTFQEVAERIVRMMGPGDSDSNNERTLRRRVYDVLNVFVAAGFVAKDNKTITYQQPVAIRAPRASSRDIEERLKSKETELGDKIRMFVHWRILIDRNRHRPKPPSAIPLSKTLFIGFKRCEGGGYERHLDGKSLSVRANSPPLFFSPMNVLTEMGISRQVQYDVLKEYPELHPMLPVLFPDIADEQ